MKQDINFELIAKQYKCAVAIKYRALKPEEINSLPLGKTLVSKKIDGELWMAHIDKAGAILFAKGGRFIKEGKITKARLDQIIDRTKKGGAEIVKYLVKKKNLDKEYAGVIYLDGCFTAAGASQGTDPKDLNNFGGALIKSGEANPIRDPYPIIDKLLYN